VNIKVIVAAITVSTTNHRSCIDIIIFIYFSVTAQLNVLNGLPLSSLPFYAMLLFVLHTYKYIQPSNNANNANEYVEPKMAVLTTTPRSKKAEV
jgi:hypothetical protein